MARLLVSWPCLFVVFFFKGLALTFTLVIMHVPQELMYHFMMVLVKLYLFFPPLTHILLYYVVHPDLVSI